MHYDPLLAGIGTMLRRFKLAEAWLRNAGLPTSLARVPVWVLCLHYCFMMRGKTARIIGITERIASWLATITQVSQHETARFELLDMDGGMRNDIESTKRTLLLLRELCVDVGGMFHSIDFKSRLLENTQEKFLAVVEQSCITATTLQRAFASHDARALALLRELEEAQRSIDMGTAVMNTAATAAATAAVTEVVTEVATEQATKAVTDAMTEVAAGAVAGMALGLSPQVLPDLAPPRDGGPVLSEPLATPAKA